MKFKKSVIYDIESSPLEKEFLDRIKTISEEVGIVFAPKEYSGALKPEHLEKAEALILRVFDDYPNNLFVKAKDLKYIGTMHTDYSHLDLDFLKSRNITFCNVPHYATEAVAELTFSVLLNIARQACEALDFVKRGNWGFQHFMGWELKGKTMGVIGLGGIGQRVAELALAFGMKVLYYSRTRKPEAEGKGITFTELGELLKESDIVSLHVPLNKETRNILNVERLSLMKNGAILLNPSRSELCDLNAVYKLAKENRIVAWFEAIEDAGLRKKFQPVKSILLTPHYAWMTQEAQKTLRDITFNNALNFLKGKPTNKIV